MNLFKSLFLTVLSVVALSAISAQDTPKESVKAFFTTFENEGSEKALTQLYSSNRWISKAEDAILHLKSQMASLTEDYVGKNYGYELLAEKRISDSYILLSYMVKFDRQPIRFTFQFYKPNNEWVIYSFKYDATLDAELEESAKLFHLNSGQ